MTSPLRVFVSSVQKELADERLIIHNLVVTDAFLCAHCSPVLYELEPASPQKALEGCLATLDSCHVYVLIVASEYGTPMGELSITHAEYRRAKARSLPVLAFIKGDRHVNREAGTVTLLAELEADGFKYKRFGDIVQLQKEVRAALVKLFREKGVGPTTDENVVAAQTIEATSSFESQQLRRIPWRDLDHSVARRLVARASAVPPESISDEALRAGAELRGLAWRAAGTSEDFATAAGIVVLARDPSAVFPQCRILADAHSGTEPDGRPRDHEDIRLPMPEAIDRALAFVDRNTRHPMRVVGLNRVRLDEYPAEALREALVNAVAHRRYEDAGSKIMLEVFADRVVISGPGLPPAPLTLPVLRKGKYRPCSRNPVLAQALSFFHRIEERGSGFLRMRNAMLDHGLEPPLLAAQTGYFQVSFPGPADDLDRLRAPEARLNITPALEAQLNERQHRIVAHALKAGSVTRRWCVEEFKVANDTAGRDLKSLVDLQLLAMQGQGRAVKYVPATPAESTENRPT